MTNVSLVNKAQLIDALVSLKAALDLMSNLNRAVDKACKNTRCQDMEDGARRVIVNLFDGINDGVYDASLEDVLDEAGLTPYVEEDLDTEDMDDEAPEEESFNAGIIMLPPCPSPEETAELVRWYNSQGWGIIRL